MRLAAILTRVESGETSGMFGVTRRHVKLPQVCRIDSRAARARDCVRSEIDRRVFCPSHYGPRVRSTSRAEL